MHDAFKKSCTNYLTQAGHTPSNDSGINLYFNLFKLGFWVFHYRSLQFLKSHQRHRPWKKCLLCAPKSSLPELLCQSLGHVVRPLNSAAVLNGIICRIQGYTNSQRLRCLQDCTLYLLALKYGLIVSTKNISDYDFCNQLGPSGRVLFYRN